MKTMTCKELGGTCNAKLRASSWDEMAHTMTNHVMNRHPDVAKKMVEMYEADLKQWGREMEAGSGMRLRNRNRKLPDGFAKVGMLRSRFLCGNDRSMWASRESE